ncbi:hypothetical protein C4J97_2917 [Pseudomonas orientalis]|nr:hypothetical protein C4J97_2917 [Pseudomonas orientalis]
MFAQNAAIQNSRNTQHAPRLLLHNPQGQGFYPWLARLLLKSSYIP